MRFDPADRPNGKSTVNGTIPEIPPVDQEPKITVNVPDNDFRNWIRAKSGSKIPWKNVLFTKIQNHHRLAGRRRAEGNGRPKMWFDGGLTWAIWATWSAGKTSWTTPKPTTTTCLRSRTTKCNTKVRNSLTAWKPNGCQIFCRRRRDGERRQDLRGQGGGQREGRLYENRRTSRNHQYCLMILLICTMSCARPLPVRNVKGSNQDSSWPVTIMYSIHYAN